jgi:Sulfotransferase family
MENNAAMDWAWPFKPRVSDSRNGEDNYYLGGDACPDFLCIGAQKGGTSWLYRQLAPHPDFWMPPVKELHYFDELSRIAPIASARPRDDRDCRFLESIKRLSARSHLDLEDYARLFGPKGTLLSGDITPAYSMLSDEIIERIVDRFPNLKVIFLARDPVERAWSQLSMGVRLRNINPFDATDADDVIRNLLNPGVLLRSHPSKIVARWKRYVRPELFRTYFFDDLEENPAELRRSIFLFLGADPSKPSGRTDVNHNRDAGRVKLRLTDKVRSRVAQFFEQELKACAVELGGPAKQWPARYGFSLFILFVQLLDDFDVFFWCDWIV